MSKQLEPNDRKTRASVAQGMNYFDFHPETYQSSEEMSMEPADVKICHRDNMLMNVLLS